MASHPVKRMSGHKNKPRARPKKDKKRKKRK